MFEEVQAHTRHNAADHAMWVISLDRYLDVKPVLALLALLGFCAVVGWTWRRYGKAVWNYRVLAIAATLGTLLLVGGMMVGRPPDADEMEHAHAAWLMSQGQLPYADFWQHHSPALWIVLAPLVGNMSPGAHICDVARLVALGADAGAVILVALLALSAWKDRQVILFVVLLVVGQAVALQLYNLRPDLVANVLCLGALYVMARHRSLAAFASAGVLLGISLSFTPKHASLLLVAPLLLIWARGQYAHHWRYLLLHFAGTALGLAPLIVWLSSKGLRDEYVRWVIQFNTGGELQFGGSFPLFLTVLGLWGAVQRVQSRELHQQHLGKLLLIALLLSALGYMTQPMHKIVYGLQMFALLAAVLGAGPALRFAQTMVQQRRTILLSILVGIYLWPALYTTQQEVRHRGYFRGRAEIQTLIDITGSDSVVCVPPAHPIFAFDATYLSQPWQFYEWLDKPGIRAGLRGIEEQIIQMRPALVFDGIVRDGSSTNQPAKPGGGFVGHLAAHQVLTPQQASKLTTFLQVNYRRVRIGSHYYWVRADRELPPGTTTRPGI